MAMTVTTSSAGQWLTKYAQPLSAILIALLMPFAAWAQNDATLRAAVLLSLISGLTALHNWVSAVPVKTSPSPPPLPDDPR